MAARFSAEQADHIKEVASRIDDEVDVPSYSRAMRLLVKLGYECWQEMDHHSDNVIRKG